MIRYKFFGYLFFGMYILIFISSCAAPISKRYRQEATPNVTFPLVFQDPAAYKGSIVIWGGVIIRTVNLKNGSELFILETPLGSREKPKGSDYARGRFIAISSSYLDSLVYRRGRKVTLAGEVAGEREIVSLKGKQSYTYPVVMIKDIHLWKRARAWYPAYYPPYYYGGYSPFYYGGPSGDEFYGDGFGDGGIGEGDEGGNEGEEVR
ncbi:MAG: Slp family lipoprotein [Nitrospiraceae bacterium]|nr:Slp family lipoprotein [Nitrospiraceae bacterium]